MQVLFHFFATMQGYIAAKKRPKKSLSSRPKYIFGKCVSHDEKWYMVRWDEIESQKSAHSVPNDVCAPKKNALVKNFTSTKFYGPIRLGSLIGGHPQVTISKIRELSL